MDSKKKKLSDVEKAIIKTINKLNRKKSKEEPTSRNIHKLLEEKEVGFSREHLGKILARLCKQSVIEAFRYSQEGQHMFCYRMLD